MKRPAHRRIDGPRALAVSLCLHGGFAVVAATTVCTVAAMAGWRASEASAYVEVSLRMPRSGAESIATLESLLEPTPNQVPLLADVLPELPEPTSPAFDTRHLVLTHAEVLVPMADEPRTARQLAARIPPSVEPLPAEVSSPTLAEVAAIASEGAAFVEASAIPGHNRRPDYPESARVRGHQGTVTILLDVDAAGEVTDARLVQSSGHRLLDNAALRCLRQWRFTPARRRGVAVASTVQQEVTFRIADT